MNELKKMLIVLSIVMAFSSAIIGISVLVYMLIEEEVISLTIGIVILLVFLLGSMGLIIKKAKT